MRQMTFSSCLADEDRELVLDSSVVINLLATGHPGWILRALGVPVVITENVVREIGQGAATGRPELDLLARMIGDQGVRVVELEGNTLETFFDLVSGSASESLGDGEGATLAFAQGHGCSAAIDEKKATRLSAARFTSLHLVTTVDILAHPAVRVALGVTGLAEATFKALDMTRMQVREHQFDWVSSLIGAERVAACSSLTRLAKQLARPPRGQGGGETVPFSGMQRNR
jgi:predicted nucleic acid-binding protein